MASNILPKGVSLRVAAVLNGIGHRGNKVGRVITKLEIEMDDTEKLTLWVGAFRYYCGRMTYAVGNFCDMLIAEWPNLPEHTRSLIAEELEAKFRIDDQMRGTGSSYCPLGQRCDRESWEKVRAIWGASC